MNSINENGLINQHYLLHELNTRYYAVLSYRNGNRASYVCHKYHISKVSLSRWNKKFDATKELLIDKTPNEYRKYLEQNKKLTQLS